MKALSFKDICLIPKYNDIPSRNDVDTSVQFGNLKLKIPVASANMDKITGAKMARKMYELGGIGFLHRFCSIEENILMYQRAVYDKSPNVKVAEAVVSLGVNEGLDRFSALYEVGARIFCVDIAHGHSKVMGKFVKQLRGSANDITIIAGNVCTYSGADYLSSCGADIIKIGISPGALCCTRIASGFGLSQFSALIDCSRVNKPIIADGGITCGGDAVKCFVAGASMIMCGTLLAGTDEAEGEPFENEDGTFYKTVRGMSSKEAQKDFIGSMPEWRASEGIQISVPCKGPVKNVVDDLVNGIRSGMTYGGCRTLDQLHKKVEYREITNNGYIEGMPHARNIVS